MKEPRIRLTVGLLMALVALSAVISRAVEHARRVRVVFANRSASRVRDVAVTYGGRSVHLGPVAPRGEGEWRIPSPPGEVVHVSWVLRGGPGEADRRVEAPGVRASKAGDTVTVTWGGD